MITVVILIAVVVVLFGIGVVLPRRSKRFQRWADDRLKRVQRWANKLPQPLQTMIKSPSRLSKKATDLASSKGRKTRHKLKDDKK